jgi:hypothetical protein
MQEAFQMIWESYMLCKFILGTSTPFFLRSLQVVRSLLF